MKREQFKVTLSLANVVNFFSFSLSLLQHKLECFSLVSFEFGVFQSGAPGSAQLKG
jgi:hypothetical protein